MKNQVSAGTIRTLVPDDIERIREALNDSFSKYFVQLDFREGTLEKMIDSFDIQYSCSTAMFEGNKITGIVLSGMRGNTAHIGPMGIIQSKQGMGLGKILMESTLKLLEKNGATKVILEVIAQNHPARRLYEKCGFKKTRILHCYHAPKKNIIKKIKLIPQMPSSLLSVIKMPFREDIYSPVSCNLTWQRDYDTIIKQKEELHCIIAYDSSKQNNGNIELENILGFMALKGTKIIAMGSWESAFEAFILKNTEFIYSEFVPFKEKLENKKIDFDGIKSRILKSVYTSLLNEALKEVPRLAFNNVTEEEMFYDFSDDLGFENYLNQFEMVYEY